MPIFMGTSNNSNSVTPAQAGVQGFQDSMDSRFRGNDIFRGILIILMICAALISPGSVIAASVERIKPEELSTKLCASNLLLLDLRDAELWEKSKIKIKCSRRVDPDDEASWIDNLPYDKEIVLYDCS